LQEEEQADWRRGMEKNELEWGGKKSGGWAKKKDVKGRLEFVLPVAEKSRHEGIGKEIFAQGIQTNNVNARRGWRGKPNQPA